MAPANFSNKKVFFDFENITVLIFLELHLELNDTIELGKLQHDQVQKKF